MFFTIWRGIVFFFFFFLEKSKSPQKWLKLGFHREGHVCIAKNLICTILKVISNQIKSLLLSHHHSTSALVSEIHTSVLQTVQKTTIYIWTVHIYRLYRRQCAKYTNIYSVHTVYYKDILNYQRHIIHRMGTSTLCTVSIHYVVYT